MNQEIVTYYMNFFDEMRLVIEGVMMKTSIFHYPHEHKQTNGLTA